MDNCVECGQIPTYADDSTYIVATNTRFQSQEKITMNIGKLKNFLGDNSLSVNLGKRKL